MDESIEHANDQMEEEKDESLSLVTLRNDGSNVDLNDMSIISHAS